MWIWVKNFQTFAQKQGKAENTRTVKELQIKKKTPLLPEMFGGLDNFEFSLK